MSPPSPRERPRRFQTRSHPTASLRDPRGALLVGVVGLARFLIGKSWNQCQSPRTSASSGGVSPQDTPLPLHFLEGVPIRGMGIKSRRFHEGSAEPQVPPLRSG